MRRRHWLIALFVLIGLWVYTHRSQNGDLHAPPAPAPAPTSMPERAAPVAVPELRRDPPASPAPSPSTTLPTPRGETAYPAFLPPEAHPVLAAIAQGGPYAYRQDGGVFQNRERRLPSQPRGYYHEFTVETPGSRDRGARRIITGGGSPGRSPPREYWYTDDHYGSFKPFAITAAEGRP